MKLLAQRDSQIHLLLFYEHKEILERIQGKIPYFRGKTLHCPLMHLVTGKGGRHNESTDP